MEGKVSKTNTHIHSYTKSDNYPLYTKSLQVTWPCRGRGKRLSNAEV